MMPNALALYVIRRLLALCGLLVLISFLVFSLLYISPGNPVDILLGDVPRTPGLVAAIQKEYHLNEPFLTQYWIWAKNALHFKFGNSIQTTLPVSDEIGRRWTTSVFLATYAFILTTFFGVGLGIVSALRQGSIADRGVVAGALIGLSTPAFVSGVVLLYVFAILLPWFPVFGNGQGFVDQLWHLTLPAVALALFSSAYLLKHTRAAVIRVRDQDYVTFARARGLSQARILFRYVLRNALIPIVTISGLQIGFLLVGAVLVEVTFSLSGLGSLLVSSAIDKDLPMLQGVAMLVAVIVMGANLLADLAYVAADPRIRLGRRAT